jgi:hypothetical protein
MKRFHVHVAVNELPESVRFYSALFGADPYASLIEQSAQACCYAKIGQILGDGSAGYRVGDFPYAGGHSCLWEEGQVPSKSSASACCVPLAAVNVAQATCKSA